MTPAIKFLVRSGIPHTVHRYQIGAIDGTYGEAVAAALDVVAPVARLKSGELVVGLVPVSGSLDLRRLAVAAGAKSAELAAPDDAERATGYVTGGISPFGQRRRLRTFADASLSNFETVFVSAGRRGLQVEVRPGDLMRALAVTATSLAA